MQRATSCRVHDAARRDAIGLFPMETPVPPSRPADAVLDEFAAESDLRPTAAPRRPAGVWVLGLLAVGSLAFGAWTLIPPVVPAPATATVRVESDPPGADVMVDGIPRGTTPQALTLPAGGYTLSLRHEGRVEEMPMAVEPGLRQVFHVTWTDPEAAAPAPAIGRLVVTSDEPGARVIVDGVDRGTTPLALADIPAGTHEVTVRSAAATVRRRVEVEPGAETSLVVGSAPAVAAAWGWITVTTPFPVQVLERGRIVGTSELDRIMLPPGDHDLEFAAAAYGFHQAVRVQIAPDRGGPVPLAIPEVPLHLSAIPWAEVFVNDAYVGDTPVTDVTRPLGDHEIVFRHPQLGERRRTVRVTLREAPRVIADMRAP